MNKDFSTIAIDSYNMSASTEDSVMGYVVPRQDSYYDVYIKGTGEMKGYSQSPFKVDGYNIKNVYISTGVTSIGNNAFSGCTSLTSITIPESVTSIGASVFRGCSSLESITLPFVGNRAGVTSTDSYQYPFGYIFGDSSYDGSVSTTQDYYGFNLKLETATYYIPSTLKEVTITGGYIPYGAFENCDSLTSITIGNSVTSIGWGAFSYCTSLTSIELDSNNSNYQSIDGNLYSKDGKTLIQYVIGKTSLSFTIPNGVTSIGLGAFSYCTSLTSITIPDSVTSIGKYAFIKCRSLTSIEIPDSVTSIGRGAFSGCTSLTRINFNGTKAQWKAITKRILWKYKVKATYVTCSDGTINF